MKCWLCRDIGAHHAGPCIWSESHAYSAHPLREVIDRIRAEHIPAANCFCLPRLDYDDWASDGQVWVHKGVQA